MKAEQEILDIVWFGNTTDSRDTITFLKDDLKDSSKFWEMLESISDEIFKGSHWLIWQVNI